MIRQNFHVFLSKMPDKSEVPDRCARLAQRQSRQVMTALADFAVPAAQIIEIFEVLQSLSKFLRLMGHSQNYKVSV
jgi:hypothetical protein